MHNPLCNVCLVKAVNVKFAKYSRISNEKQKRRKLSQLAVDYSEM